MPQLAGIFHELARDDSRRRLAIDLMVAAGMALFLTAVDAFAMPWGFWPRLLYWLLLLPAPVVGGRLLFQALARSRSSGAAAFARALLLAVALTFLSVLVIGVITSLLFAGRVEWRWIPRFLMFGLIGDTAIAAVAILAHRAGQAPTSSLAAKTEEPPALLGKLPFPYRDAGILAIEAQGHGLRVHTDLGTPMIWLGLTQGIEALAPLDGFQVHRSWWVAKAAIVRADRSGRGAVLTLANGAKVPVSRARMPLLRDDGFL